jgi:hypothetical protein
MSVVTSQQLNRYFEQFSTQEIVFTKDVNDTLLIYKKNIHFKCLGYQWPCVIFSCSLSGAKIIANLVPGIKDIIERANSVVNLRFSFIQKDKSDPISFFVPARVENYEAYGDERNTFNYINLKFNSKPANELIYRLGNILEIRQKSRDRKEERIVLNKGILQLLGLENTSVLVSIDNVPRKGILRDLSMSGMKILLQGIAKFLVNKPIIIKMVFKNASKPILMKGSIMRFETIEGRDDLAIFGVQLEEHDTPLEYYKQLNRFFDYLKKNKSKLLEQESNS